METFLQKRKRELGLTPSSKSEKKEIKSEPSEPESFLTKRKMDLGLIPDVRVDRANATNIMNQNRPSIVAPTTIKSEMKLPEKKEPKKSILKQVIDSVKETGKRIDNTVMMPNRIVNDIWNEPRDPQMQPKEAHNKFEQGIINIGNAVYMPGQAAANIAARALTSEAKALAPSYKGMKLSTNTGSVPKNPLRVTAGKAPPVKTPLQLTDGSRAMKMRSALERSKLQPNLNPIQGKGDIKVWELPEASDFMKSRYANVADGKRELKGVTQELDDLQKQHQKTLTNQYNYLRDSVKSIDEQVKAEPSLLNSWKREVRNEHESKFDLLKKIKATAPTGIKFVNTKEIPQRLKHLSKPSGLHIDIVAKELGYDDVEQMLEAVRVTDRLPRKLSLDELESLARKEMTRTSAKNPAWYNQFQAENGRPPTNRDLYRLAQKQVDEGYQDETGDVPSWKKANNYDDMVEALTGVKGSLEESLKDMKPEIIGRSSMPLTTAGRAGNVPKLPSRPPTVTSKPVSASVPTKPSPKAETPVQTPKTEVKPSPEMDALEKEYQIKKDIVTRSLDRPEEKSARLKGLAMQHAADKRHLTQGDSLVPVEGGFTDKELTNKINTLKTNYSGKPVIVDGKEGTVTKNSFGKVGVQFDDGTEKFFTPEQIKPSVDIDQVIKNQSERTVTPKSEQPNGETPESATDISNSEFIDGKWASENRPITGTFYRGRSASDSGPSGEARYGDGKYYANNKRTAQIFADFRGEGASVEEGKITLNKPFVDHSVDLKTPEAQKLIQLLKDAGMPEGYIPNLFRGERDAPFNGIAKFLSKGDAEKSFWPGAQKANEMLKKAGYDGIVGENRNSPDLPNHIEIVQFKKEPTVNKKGTDTPKKSEVVTKEPVVAEKTTTPTPPKQTPTGEKELGFITTLKESSKTPKGLMERLKASYEPITNQGTVNQANQHMKDIEKASAFVKGDVGDFDVKVTTAHRLIDSFNKQKNWERATDTADEIARQGMKLGQGVQAFAIYNRLTPEGMLVRASRVANKTNEHLNILQKEVKVTPKMAEDINELATVTQKMTGVKDLSNDFVDIVDKAKSGAKLEPEEVEKLTKFLEEAQQFVKETVKKEKIKPPIKVESKAVQSKTLAFLERQEQAAKERLKAKGHQLSSTPLDIYADYAIIGAAKMARGTIKFADWSAEMIKDFGEEIKPLLENLYNKSSETFNKTSKKVTRANISNAEKIVDRLIKTGKLQGSAAEEMKTLASKVTELSGDAKDMASQDLQVILKQLEKPTFLRKVSATQTIAQLLNPKTQVRNALGNELFYRLERANKYVTAPVDWTRVKLFGGKRSVTFRTNNQGEYWKNWMKGLKAGWRGVNVDGLQTQFDLGPSAFSSKWNPLTYMEKALGASLKSFDTAAYKRAVNDTIGEMATLRAMNEGLTGVAKKEAIQKYIRTADDHILNIADEYGKYMTFQDNNMISKGLSYAKKGLNAGKDFGLGDLVIKYPKTPGALLMRSLEYSPSGFLRSASIASRPWFNKTPNTREAMLALSRAIVGTGGLTGMGYFLYDKGILTGSASSDRDVRDLQKQSGAGPYQVNLSALKRWVYSGFDPKEAKIKPDDVLYTYDWMQPVAISASIGANVRKNLQEGKDVVKGIGSTAYDSIEGGVNTLFETSVLSGLKRATESYPGQSVMDKVTDILGGMPASFVPTAVNQTKQLMDNQQRETYSPDKLEQAFNQMKVKVPGWEKQLPPRYDTLGQKKETYQNNSLFNVLLNPGFQSKYKLSPEAKMVVDIITDTGDTGVAPRVPQKYINIKDADGKTVKQKLTGEQFSELQRLTGEETLQLFQEMDPTYTNEEKLRVIPKLLTRAGELARYHLKETMGINP